MKIINSAYTRKKNGPATSFDELELILNFFRGGTDIPEHKYPWLGKMEFYQSKILVLESHKIKGLVSFEGTGRDDISMQFSFP